jgi:microcystin-dependent protein
MNKKMKLTLAFVLLLCFNSMLSFAQITTGMAIQGIARDASNNAITNSSIGLKLTVHYANGGQDYSPAVVTTSVSTDAFGVFSYVLDMTNIETSLYFNYQLKLKIEQTSPTSNLISDENLNYAPLAISAGNGVPTGTIMPYIGNSAPRGWLVCDGTTIPNNINADALKVLLGGNVLPDLRGMFLRGAGTNSNASYSNNVGPALKSVQTDGIKTHTSAIPDHSHGITDPTHSHPYMDIFFSESGGPVGVTSSFGSGDSDHDNGGYEISRTTSASATNVSINNASLTATYTGGTETRPVNYGVTYIIKL